MSSTEAIEKASLRPEYQVARQPGGHFAKGVSGNPGGKPKDTPSLTRAVQRLLDENPSEIDILARATVENAKAGNSVALKQVWDRLDGAVTEKQLIERVEAGELSEDALIAAGRALERKRALASENLAPASPVEVPLDENRSSDMGENQTGLNGAQNAGNR